MPVIGHVYPAPRVPFIFKPHLLSVLGSWVVRLPDSDSALGLGLLCRLTLLSLVESSVKLFCSVLFLLRLFPLFDLPRGSSSTLLSRVLRGPTPFGSTFLPHTPVVLLLITHSVIPAWWLPDAPLIPRIKKTNLPCSSFCVWHTWMTWLLSFRFDFLSLVVVS